MKSKQFIRIIGKLINNYLNYINNSELVITGVYSYNNILRVAESSTHFVCELCGSKEYKKGQAISINLPNKPEKIKGDTTSYFWQKTNSDSDEEAMFKISAKGCIFSNLNFGLMALLRDFRLAEEINLPVRKAKIVGDINKFKIPILILPEADYILFNNIDLLEINGVCVHYRIMPSVFVIKKPVNEEDLKRELQINFSSPLCNIGLNIGLNTSIEHFADQLFSLSTQEVKECVLDNFIQKHANYFAKALGYKSALSQKELVWEKREKNDPEVSKPDFLMERFDGYYDILDLKTGATKYKSVTKSKKSGKDGKIRIRFIDYVNELLAQLKDYERYFSYQENIKYSYEKYGVKVKDLKLIGVVGNYNNFDRTEVDYSIDKDNVLVYSYNDVRDLLRTAYKN